jgi:excisionase family DNA binding protein
MSSNIRVNRICEFCSTEFEAKTTVTKYCGDTCAKKAYKARKRAEKIEVSKKETKEVITRPIEEIRAKEFLSITETCKLVGVSRRTVYRCIERGDLIAGKLGKRTIIKRSEIDKLFEPPNLIAPQEKSSADPVEFIPGEFYSLTEAQQKFGISEAALQTLIKREHIPKVKISRYAYIPKSSIDKLFT